MMRIILRTVGIVLIVLQVLSLIGGGIPTVGGAYGAGLLIGMFTPGIVGVILVVISFSIKKK